MPGEGLADGLRRVLDVERIDDLRRLSGGASRETWSFDAVTTGGAMRQLVVRLESRPADGPGFGGSVPEQAVLEAAHRAGVPVPAVVAGADDAADLGAPYLVTERIEGETIPPRILRDDRYATARDRLAGQCGAALAALHRIPVSNVPGLEEIDPLARLREVLDELDQPHPTLELGLRWLHDTRPPPSGRSIVHGDFRHGNLIVGPDGLRAVLDWELAHVGDPAADLGWLCIRAWRFGVPERRVGGFGDVDDLLSAYAAAGGPAIDADTVRWWEVLGTVRWGVICIVQAFTHLSGATRSVELAAIGRRVCETEWDLLDLLDEVGGR